MFRILILLSIINMINDKSLQLQINKIILKEAMKTDTPNSKTQTYTNIMEVLKW
jgi:hypothetical protein